MTQGELAPRGYLQVIANRNASTPQKDGSGRAGFAKWLTGDNPLTARVMANRIWLWHFGQGIVRTPDDFGSSGAAPTHPKLLDWLAREFINSGWDIKHIHRLIVLSSVYRQVSRPAPEVIARSERIDPDNLFLWRQSLRRLGAEPLRDAVLSVSGRLNQQPFGGARASGTNDKAGGPLNLLRWLSPRSVKRTLDIPQDWRYSFLEPDE